MKINMQKIIKAAFEQRRKTLPNSLASVFGELTKEELTDVIVKCGYDPVIRGEKLGVADFVTLSDEIFARIKDKK